MLWCSKQKTARRRCPNAYALRSIDVSIREMWLRVQIVDFMAAEVLAALYGSPSEAAD